MKKITLIAVAMSIPFVSFADVQCSGTISKVYKASGTPTLSVLVSGASRWINLPTLSDESMALTAYAANKQVTFNWVAADIISCTDGWLDHRAFTGSWTIN